MNIEWPTMESIEKEVIAGRLQAFDCNMVETAKSLEIGRTTLYRKCKKYKLEIERNATCQKEH